MSAKDDRRAELEAELAALDTDDDESDEVTIGRPDGSTFTGSVRRAIQLGWLTKPEPKAEPKKAEPRVSVLTPRKRTGA